MVAASRIRKILFVDVTLISAWRTQQRIAQMLLLSQEAKLPWKTPIYLFQTELEQQLANAEEKASQTEIFPRQITSEDQQEVLRLLCRAHELELGNTELQANTLYKENLLCRKDFVIQQLQQHMLLCEEMIRRQQMLIKGKAAPFLLLCHYLQALFSDGKWRTIHPEKPCLGCHDTTVLSYFSRTLPPHLCSSPEHSCPRDTGEVTPLASLWVGGEDTEPASSTFSDVQHAQGKAEQTLVLGNPHCPMISCYGHRFTHPQSLAGSWCQSGAVQSFVLWTCCLWSSTLLPSFPLTRRINKAFSNSKGPGQCCAWVSVFIFPVAVVSDLREITGLVANRKAKVRWPNMQLL